MTPILIIDDDERLAGPLSEFLRRHGLRLSAANHPQKGLELLAREKFELVILDVMLPGMDGFEVCRRIRETSDVPIVMLTARGEVNDRVVGLELGADDYLPKPFEPRELVARVQNILRRSEAAPGARGEDAEMHFGELVIDPARRQVRVSGKPVSLTNGEYQLLYLLAGSPGRDFSRDDILNHLRGTQVELFTRAVDIQVSRLRQKLKPVDCIKTVWGSGYRFVAPAPE